MVFKKEKSITEKLVDRIKQIPPMPSNIDKLRRAASDPNMNFVQITPIIKEDPGITADILKIANSAVYGVGHRVETIEEAVRYFGMASLAEFIAAACSEKIIRHTFSSINNLNDYLQHSKRVSFASSFISDIIHADTHDREVYSITGLLHDIGTLIILLTTGERRYTKELMGFSWSEALRSVHSENEIYGIDHAELGMMICRRWNFPDKITNGVQKHNSPLLADGKLCVEGLVVFLAELIDIDEISESVFEKTVPGEILEMAGITLPDLIDARKRRNEANLG